MVLTLKVVLALLAGLVTSLVVLTALLPAQLRVARSTRIERPRAEVARIVADMHQRTAWIPWVATDPDATYEARGEALAIGSTLRFDGPRVGAATVRLDALSDDEVRTHLTYVRPMTMESTDRFELRDVDGATEVRWINEGDLAFGPARWFGLFADRLIGGDYVRGLENLRRYAESGARADAPRGAAPSSLAAAAP